MGSGGHGLSPPAALLTMGSRHKATVLAPRRVGSSACEVPVLEPRTLCAAPLYHLCSIRSRVGARMALRQGGMHTRVDVAAACAIDVHGRPVHGRALLMGVRCRRGGAKLPRRAPGALAVRRLLGWPRTARGRRRSRVQRWRRGDVRERGAFGWGGRSGLAAPSCVLGRHADATARAAGARPRPAGERACSGRGSCWKVSDTTGKCAIGPMRENCDAASSHGGRGGAQTKT